MSKWSLDISRWTDKTKGDIDTAVRVIAIEMLTRIVMRSPVGNPELWAANAQAISNRESYYQLKAVSPKTLAKKFPLRAGKGYTGGRFRANWILSIGKLSTEISDEIDPSGGATIAAAQATLQGFTAGPSVFITNSLLYSQPLEYGHSKQSPAGMVRVTLAEFGAVVHDAVQQVRS